MGPSDVLLSTTSALEGFSVTRYWGLARGIAARAPTFAQEFDEPAFGGERGSDAEVTEQVRWQATSRMQQHGLQLGANAVLGVRYALSVEGKSVQVLCYGTAASVVRLDPPDA